MPFHTASCLSTQLAPDPRRSTRVHAVRRGLMRLHADSCRSTLMLMLLMLLMRRLYVAADVASPRDSMRPHVAADVIVPRNFMRAHVAASRGSTRGHVVRHGPTRLHACPRRSPRFHATSRVFLRLDTDADAVDAADAAITCCPTPVNAAPCCFMLVHQVRSGSTRFRVYSRHPTRFHVARR